MDGRCHHRLSAASDCRHGANSTISRLPPTWFLAARILAAFHGSEFAQPQGRILGVEEELPGGLFASRAELLSRVDLLVETESELVITDLKTARIRWGREHAKDVGDQFLLYSELVRSLVPGKAVKLRFLVITKAKSPAIDEHFVPLEPQRLACTRRTVERIWQSIVSGNYYPSPSPMNCPSCPFREPCREWIG